MCCFNGAEAAERAVVGEGSLVGEDAVVSQGDAIGDGKGLAVGNSDLCPIGDFGVALNVMSPFRSEEASNDGAIGILLAPDKQAFRMILYLGSRRNDLISILPVDGYDKGVSCDGSIIGGGTAIYAGSRIFAATADGGYRTSKI